MKIYKIASYPIDNIGRDAYYSRSNGVDKDISTQTLYRSWLEKHYPQELKRYQELKRQIDLTYKSNNLENIEALEEEYDSLGEKLESVLEELDEGSKDEDLELDNENMLSVEEELYDIYRRYLNGDMYEEWEYPPMDDPRVIPLIVRDPNLKGVSYGPTLKKIKEMGLAKLITQEQKLANTIRSAIQDMHGFIYGTDMNKFTDEQLIDAAKDLYEHRKSLTEMYRNKKKL